MERTNQKPETVAKRNIFWKELEKVLRMRMRVHHARYISMKNDLYFSLPEVQMWQEEWGAQAMPLIAARWLVSRATGVQGIRMSKMIACNRKKKLNNLSLPKELDIRSSGTTSILFLAVLCGNTTLSDRHLKKPLRHHQSRQYF